jgi:hypothetical protein
MRASVATLAGVFILAACGCGGKVQTGAEQGARDAGVEAEAGPISCAGEVCGAGEICKYETESLDATPCCGTCMDFDAAAPEVWTCTEAEEYCRMGCLAADWPYVWCMIE